MPPAAALQDVKVADAMQPFRPAFAVNHGANGSGGAHRPGGHRPAAGPDGTALPGPITYQRNPQALFATESLAQALRQLEVYGRDGLPVLSADGQQVAGWVTNTSVLRAVAREIRSSQEETAEAQAAARPQDRA
jgi:CIC family chloride channel protein